MPILFLIFILIVFIILLVLLLNNLKIKTLFEKHNVAIYGAKGKGKDLLTQLIINLRKKPYYSNIYYGGLYKKINIDQLSVEPNTYENFINGKISTIDKDILFEGMDIYLSDVGIFLPSQYDNLLSNKYKSLPIFYALSRHLYGSNIHYNSQALNRVWIKLREQADYYVKCLGVTKLLFGILIKVRTYDVYESAVNNYQPMKKSIFNKYNQAEENQFSGLYGNIEEFHVYILKSHIYYDTRYFHNVLFKEKAPNDRVKKKIERIQNQYGRNKK